jgi:hypothetical protein
MPDRVVAMVAVMVMLWPYTGALGVITGKDVTVTMVFWRAIA